MRLQNNVMARHGSSAAERWHEGGAGREVSGRREGNAPAAVSTPGGWDLGLVRTAGAEASTSDNGVFACGGGRKIQAKIVRISQCRSQRIFRRAFEVQPKLP